MKKITNFNRGFTLAEMLVVVAGIALIGMIITEVFYRSVRASNRATIQGTIKQNGLSTLEIMDKIIRGSDDILCPVSTGNTIVIRKDGIYSRYRFKIEAGVNNGSVIMDNPVPALADLNLPDSVCADIMSTVSTLTDTNPKTGVSVITGQFTRNNSSGFKDTVTINFSLKPAVNTPAAIASQISPVDFNTTIELR